jgi:hypothetical protein
VASADHVQAAPHLQLISRKTSRQIAPQSLPLDRIAERNGRWGKATSVPGLQALNTGQNAKVMSLSCTSTGYCAAGGFYSNGRGGGLSQLFVVSERNGRWGKAIEIPGLGTLNKGGDAEDVTVSCGSAGNCAAGGYYSTRGQRFHGFVATERNGRWGKATEVPGLGALSTAGDSGVGSLSCVSAGNCTASGSYTPSRHHTQGFVVTERAGRWSKAAEVPGLQALSKGLSAVVFSLSCGRAGNCAAGGEYNDKAGSAQGFVVSERNGRWGKAMAVPGLASLNTGQDAEIDAVSCSPAGNCAAGGSYANTIPPGFPETQAFVVSRSS